MTRTTTSYEQMPSFLPVDDTIAWFKDVDWQDTIHRLRSGVANVLLWAVAFSEKSYDFHEWLYNKVEPTPAEQPAEDIPFEESIRSQLDGLSIWHTPAEPPEVMDDLGRVF